MPLVYVLDYLGLLIKMTQTAFHKKGLDLQFIKTTLRDSKLVGAEPLSPDKSHQTLD